METSYIKDLFREWQREDKFFVSTRACKEIERQIKTKNFVVVAGHSGYGKSAIVHHIAVDYRAKRWYVKPVEKVDEIKEAYRNEDFRKGETLFVLNDPFGKHVLDELEYRHWKNFEKELVRFLDTHTVKLLLTCRKCIIDEMRDSISSRVFEERSIVYVDGNDFKLSRTEKRTIFKRYSPDEEGVDEKKIDDIIEIDNYFPLLCKLYASRKNQEETNTSLFKEPINFFSEEIENYRRNSKEIYCALACLVFFNNKVCLEDLKNQENQARFRDCLKICNIPIYTEPCQIIRSLESLVGKFVKKKTDHYIFIHDLIMELTTSVLGGNHLSKIIKYADISFLRTRLGLQRGDWSTIVVTDDFFESLCERLYAYLFSKRCLEVILNPCLRSRNVTEWFKQNLGSRKKMKMLIEETVEINKLGGNISLSDDQKKCWVSKFDFLNFFKKISPLFALIVFDQTDLSVHCISTLRGMKIDLSRSNIFSAVCVNGSSNLFTFFCKKDANGLGKKACGYLYPFQIAILINCANSLKELIKLGMDVNMMARGWTPLTFASATGNTGGVNDESSFVKILLDNFAMVNLRANFGESPIYLACKHGHYSTVELLLERGASVNLCTKFGESPLYVAIKNGHDSIVELLIERGAKVNLCTKEGKGPLFVGCEQ